MLNANVIMFSRSLTKDYRWIYSDECVDGLVENYVLNDYNEFEKNRTNFLEKKHLIIRQYHDHIIVYKFFETKEKDQNSRKIYALLGCIFSGLDFEIVNSIYKYFISYLYEEFDALFEMYLNDIPDKYASLIISKGFSIDLVIENLRKKGNIKILANNILQFKNQNTIQNYIISDASINLSTLKNSNLILTPKEYTINDSKKSSGVNKIDGIKDNSTIKDVKNISKSRNIEYANVQNYKTKDISQTIHTNFRKSEFDVRDNSECMHNIGGKINQEQMNITEGNVPKNTIGSELKSESASNISGDINNSATVVNTKNVNNGEKSSMDSRNVEKKDIHKKSKKYRQPIWELFKQNTEKK